MSEGRCISLLLTLFVARSLPHVFSHTSDTVYWVLSQLGIGHVRLYPASTTPTNDITVDVGLVVRTIQQALMMRLEPNVCPVPGK